MADNEQLIDKMMFPISFEMKDALGEYAAKQELSAAEVVRRAIAEAIGYEYTHKSNAGAPKKYATEEAKKAAARQRGKDKRALVRKLLDERKAQRDAEVKARDVAALKQTANR